MNAVDLLFDTVFRKRTQELAELLGLYPKEFMDISDKNGDTLLIAAAKSGDIHAIDLLITKKADINQQNRDGDTALHCALAFGHSEIAD
mmetsp:Transcript_2610/g.2251  ORF Transcript_2610/g.2251 Transcript_2610/m.2251 type:complete len:89 (+) Transcript_2610:1280-1546(+)|eukprot:CAMPEP_0114593398 /NCGR_PEP_ID=MMETSP0125-20121206/15007_1 /TAXON_ID=485358 ORGANISM="Aristerostoma sp., Strain ATCC 50986" /NCGR_SAMPLE_ID=MMETSP0125 /ASSEMBLY_ACC=CAM_ASM_000245 /LENGTH=88 /DNA_ID=CAMNT_0001792567 /DNA_START=1057 /DNA_END=1323 /DNA_ORIENTATION=+